MATREEVISALGPLLPDPSVLVDVVVLGRDVTVTLSPRGPREELGKKVRETLSKLPEVSGFEVRWHAEVRGRNIGPDDPLPEVKNVVLVMSGKGGVGKSTCATNLTMSLHRAGFRVGLLDAVSLDGKSIEPLERFGVKLMSIGFLLEDPKAAVVWRGPMLHGALLQFLKDVRWGTLDYLILDLPPGTGDVALTLAQRISSPYAVIVTTPQAVATDDVYKSVSMCEKVNIPIVGVIENMSYFVDSAGVSHELFGRGGGQAIADFAKAPLLGQIPIDQSVREWGDKGTPVVQAAPFSPIARAFIGVAERLADAVDARRTEGDEDAPPEIDRTGGSGGRKRLPVMK